MTVPSEFCVFGGYAGWGAGQLMEELERKRVTALQERAAAQADARAARGERGREEAREAQEVKDRTEMKGKRSVLRRRLEAKDCTPVMNYVNDSAC